MVQIYKLTLWPSVLGDFRPCAYLQTKSKRLSNQLKIESSQMRKSIVKERFSKGLAVHCFKSNIPHCMVPEIIGLQGIDCLWLDFEHLPTSLETAFSLVQACRGTGMDSLLRVGNREFSRAARMLDLGATGIMYPRARSADEVAELVKYVRFPPLGIRGVDPGVPAGQYGAFSPQQYIDWANKQTFIMVQIETKHALEDVDAIAAVPGIDILFVGTCDLSVELNIPINPRENPMLDCIKTVAQAAKKHNKVWGTPAFSPEHAKELLEMGALFIPYDSDTSILRKTILEIQDTFRELGFTYHSDDAG